MTDTATAATKRPWTVIAGILFIALQSVLGVLVGFILLSSLGSATGSAEDIAQAQLLCGVLIATSIINAVALVFVARGYGAARFVLVVVGGVIVVLDIVGGKPTLGDFLWVGAIVLLFLPASSAWFRAKAALRG